MYLIPSPLLRYPAPTQPGPVVGVRLGKYREGSTAVAYPALAPIFSTTTHAAVASLQACLDAIYHQPHVDERAALFDRVAARLSVYDAVTKAGNWCDVTVRESRLGDCLMEVRVQRGNLTDVSYCFRFLVLTTSEGSSTSAVTKMGLSSRLHSVFRLHFLIYRC